MVIGIIKGHDNIEKDDLSLNKLMSIVKKTHKETLLEGKKELLKEKDVKRW